MNEPVAWMQTFTQVKDGVELVKHAVNIEQVGINDIPLYTQDQLEEARKLGMQQERALWNLSASTQEIMDTHPVKEPDFTVEKDSQDWKGMDGATAFWLIERHSNHWDDARLMMEEWLEANSHPVKELNDGGEPVKNATYWKRQYNLMATQNDNLKSGLYHANEQIKYLESHPVNTCKHGVDDGACKECYMEAQEK